MLNECPCKAFQKCVDILLLLKWFYTLYHFDTSENKDDDDNEEEEKEEEEQDSDDEMVFSRHNLWGGCAEAQAQTATHFIIVKKHFYSVSL